MAKLLRNAQQARKKMGDMRGVGKSGSVGIIINGMYQPLEIEVDEAELRNMLARFNIEDKLIREIKNIFEKDIKNSLASANKDLQTEMSKSTSMDDFKKMLE